MRILETERLVIRPATLSDGEFLLRLMNDPSFIANIADRGLRTLDDAERYLNEKFIQSYELNGHGSLIVVLKKTRELIGVCGIIKRDTLPEPDIGFAYLPEYWQNGYAFEAAQTVLAHAKNSLKLKRVLGITSPNNFGSIRTLEKLGLKYQETISLTADDPVKLFSIEF